MKRIRTALVVAAIGVACSLVGAALEQDASAGAAVKHGLLGAGAALVRRRIRVVVDIGGENGKA